MADWNENNDVDNQSSKIHIDYRLRKEHLYDVSMGVWELRAGWSGCEGNFPIKDNYVCVYWWKSVRGIDLYGNLWYTNIITYEHYNTVGTFGSEYYYYGTVLLGDANCNGEIASNDW